MTPSEKVIIEKSRSISNDNGPLCIEMENNSRKHKTSNFSFGFFPRFKFGKNYPPLFLAKFKIIFTHG